MVCSDIEKSLETAFKGSVDEVPPSSCPSKHYNSISMPCLPILLIRFETIQVQVDEEGKEEEEEEADEEEDEEETT